MVHFEMRIIFQFKIYVFWIENQFQAMPFISYQIHIFSMAAAYMSMKQHTFELLYEYYHLYGLYGMCYRPQYDKI